jgi:hypothetical protein
LKNIYVLGVDDVLVRMEEKQKSISEIMCTAAFNALRPSYKDKSANDYVIDQSWWWSKIFLTRTQPQYQK